MNTYQEEKRSGGINIINLACSVLMENIIIHIPLQHKIHSPLPMTIKGNIQSQHEIWSLWFCDLYWSGCGPSWFRTYKLKDKLCVLKTPNIQWNSVNFYLWNGKVWGTHSSPWFIEILKIEQIFQVPLWFWSVSLFEPGSVP